MSSHEIDIVTADGAPAPKLADSAEPVQDGDRGCRRRFRQERQARREEREAP